MIRHKTRSDTQQRPRDLGTRSHKDRFALGTAAGRKRTGKRPKNHGSRATVWGMAGFRAHHSRQNLNHGSVGGWARKCGRQHALDQPREAEKRQDARMGNCSPVTFPTRSPLTQFIHSDSAPASLQCRTVQHLPSGIPKSRVPRRAPRSAGSGSCLRPFSGPAAHTPGFAGPARRDGVCRTVYCARGDLKRL